MAETKRVQKKAFYEVKAPMTAAKINLYAASASVLDGKIITIDLTRSLRGKSLELKMKVKSDGDALNAEPVSIALAGSYIRRAMRKGVDYVEDSFSAQCKDRSVIIKPFMLTRNKVSRAIRQSIREAARKHLESYLKNHTVKEVFTEITTNKIQKELSLKLKKIYPLALCEIRVFKVLGEK